MPSDPALPRPRIEKPGHHIPLAVVAQHHPELADAVRRLREEHPAMDMPLQRLQQVVGAADVDRASVRTEVDRLTAAVEAHLDYEEAQLLPVLAALRRTDR